jgi:predicted PurR-regulated permease PerM
MGASLGLRMLVVFLSLIFWGWVLGPIGMLLAVPLTMTVKSLLCSHEQTKWMGDLLAPAPALER